jgi:excisionase family DNA binding protein
MQWGSVAKFVLRFGSVPLITSGTRMAVSSDPTEPQALLSPAQIAQICSLSRRAVYDAIGRGELKAFRLCDRLRISTEQLADWLRRSAIAEPTGRPAPEDAQLTPAAVARPGSFRAKLAAAEDSE